MRANSLAGYRYFLPIGAASLGCCAAFHLSPSVPPREVVERHLAALKEGDVETAYKFAKEKTDAVGDFAEMMQSDSYRHLVGHLRSEILVESKIRSEREFFVRVTSPPPPSDPNVEEEEEPSASRNERPKVVEYWWTLSRCRTGEFAGSYMVDAVNAIPFLRI